MIVIEGNHTLTLSNIVLDGKAYRKDIDIEHCNSIISLGKSAGAEKNGAKLVLNTGSILENNNAPQLQGNAIAGYSYNTIIIMMIVLFVIMVLREELSLEELFL